MYNKSLQTYINRDKMTLQEASSQAEADTIKSITEEKSAEIKRITQQKMAQMQKIEAKKLAALAKK